MEAVSDVSMTYDTEINTSETVPALHLCMQPRTPVLLTEAVNVHLGVITVTSSKHSDTIASRFELSYAYEPVRKKKKITTLCFRVRVRKKYGT